MLPAQFAPAQPFDCGLAALAVIARYYRIAADPAQLAHELGLAGHASGSGDLVRAAQRLGFKGRIVKDPLREALWYWAVRCARA